MCDEEQIEIIKTKLLPYIVEITNIWYMIDYQKSLYDVKIIFDKNIIISDSIYLDELTSDKINILKKEFEKIDSKKYLLVRKEIGKIGEYNPILIKTLINLHSAINKFCIEDYRDYNCESVVYKTLLNSREMDFHINYHFHNNKINIINKINRSPRKFIEFILNNEGGKLFPYKTDIEKIKLLAYYSELFNFKDKLLDSIEKQLLGGN